MDKYQDKTVIKVFLSAFCLIVGLVVMFVIYFFADEVIPGVEHNAFIDFIIGLVCGVVVWLVLRKIIFSLVLKTRQENIIFDEDK